METSLAEIKKRVSTSLYELARNDNYLIKNSLHELAFASRLACYLQKEFPKYNVDVSYNRKGGEAKVLEGITECRHRNETGRVAPDIVIHDRGNNDHNLIVMELKKDSDDICDFARLKKFTSIYGDYGYKLGVFIKFFKNGRVRVKWFRNGSEYRF